MTLKEQMKLYFIDVSAAWVFYTFFLGFSEIFIVQMSLLVVLKSRLIGMLVHAIAMRPYGKLREFWSDLWGLGKDSHSFYKFISDSLISVLYQIPIYTAILFLAGATVSEWMIALPIGLLIGASTGRIYGFWLDKWRLLWGGKSVFEKSLVFS